MAGVLGAFALAHGPRAPLALLPTASGGLAALTAGGVIDALWHEAFGIEASFQALVSPPHLVVFAGLVLLMLAPPSAVADGPSTPLDAVRSLVLALSVTSLLLVISLFTGYLTPLIGGSELQAGAYIEALVGTSYLDYDTSRGLAQTLWFGVLASLVVVLVRARTAPVAGTWTVAFGLLGLAPMIASGTVALPLTVALVVFGLVSDLGATRQRPHPLATGLAAAAMWAAMFAVIGARDELLWGASCGGRGGHRLPRGHGGGRRRPLGDPPAAGRPPLRRRPLGPQGVGPATPARARIQSHVSAAASALRWTPSGRRGSMTSTPSAPVQTRVE